MQSPYTQNLPEAYFAAQSSLGAVLTGVAWFRRMGKASFLVMLVAIWLPVTLPFAALFWAGMGGTVRPDFSHELLRASSLALVFAMALSTPRWLAIVAFIVHRLLLRADDFFLDSDLELASAHMCGVAFMLGLHHLVSTRRSPLRAAVTLPADEFLVHDLTYFFTAMFAAALVSTWVLGRSCDSADEWSYTYQAAVFAKGRAYSEVPPCVAAFQNFWVFYKEGRMFSQYTPGWPLFCAPFQALGLMWLAAPVTHGLLAAGVARVARRAVSLERNGRTRAHVREVAVAGAIAALTVTFAASPLINGASRFPHTFVCACFAWSIEAVCVLAGHRLSPRAQWAWGALLGLSTAFMLSARPADGGFLGLGIFLYFLYSLSRRRIGLRAFGGTTVTFSALAGLTLVILHKQLGEWFVTGYSLLPEFHSWAKLGYSWPEPNQYRYGLPLATGAYCWWPLAPALGVGGLATMLRRGAGHLAMMLTVGGVGLLALYVAIEFGRGFDFGYGPRYQMHLVVPMSVGGAALLAPLVSAALGKAKEVSALRLGGPAAIFVVFAVLGALRIVPLTYPVAHEDVRLRNVVFAAIKQERVHHAVVTVSKGSTISDQLDLTQNLPLELYPNQDVLVVSDRGPEVNQCVRNQFPQRRFYRAVGRPEVTLTVD